MSDAAVAEKPESKKRSNIRPLMGNEAIARGVWEAGAKVCAAYPGTPSTEILENIARYPEQDIEVEWASNEKTALDIAMGASFAGVRAFAAMKHVGVNVASDTLMSQSYIGVNGALVMAVADDPGIHSSQNEQDTRMFAKFAGVPILEPVDAQQALDYTRLAFDISEQFDTLVIVRTTTRLSHTRSAVVTGERKEKKPKDFNDEISKNVMIPSHARLRHSHVIAREKAIGDYFDENNMAEWAKGSGKIGIITAGPASTYVHEVIPEASILTLPSSFPLTKGTIKKFMDEVDKVLVVEELEPVIEDQLKIMGYDVAGKEFFSREGEFSPETVRQGLEKSGFLKPRTGKKPIAASPIPRPPVLCAGCPHISSYMALNGINARVAGDIGCYTLAAIEPLKAIDTTVAMGSSIGNAVGMARAGTETRPIVATIGDSTFIHSGIPPLIDAVYSKANITILLLDNHITAMTGGQDHAATGISIRGKHVERINFAELIASLGVKWIREIDSYDMGKLYQTVREATLYKGVSVVISNRPCVLDPTRIRGESLKIKTENCTACQSCMNLGCPALVWDDEMYDGQHKVRIDPVACIGCSMCIQVCPTDSIRPMADFAAKGN